MQIKEDQASEFIMSLRADRETSVPLGIDPALLAAAKGGKGPLSANFLIACIATMMLPLRQCAVIAGNGAVMRVCPTQAQLWASHHNSCGCHIAQSAPVGKLSSSAPSSRRAMALSLGMPDPQTPMDMPCPSTPPSKPLSLWLSRPAMCSCQQAPSSLQCCSWENIVRPSSTLEP